MAYSETLAERIRGVLEASQAAPRISEQKMFGGLTFLVSGNMCVGVYGDGLLVRAAPEDHETLLARPHVHVFDMGRRPMKGWLVVAADGVKTKRQLVAWVARGEAFASSLPPK